MFYLKLHHIHVFEFNLKSIFSFSRNSKQILHDISLNINEGEIFGIVGPSGCGKTILLKIIAGLVFPEAGEIYLEEKDITRDPPFKRGISIVFQDFVLYPHMTNLKNINFPVLLHTSRDKSHHSIEIEKVASLLHIDEEMLLNKFPRYTSLGERQRIAIGKAVISCPKILLLDEPLSNIEDSLRTEIRHNLRKMIKENNITAVYVSHNQMEIGEISDNIAVMQKGIVEQVGTYQELYDNPKTLFVSTIIGEKTNNILPAEEVKYLTNSRIAYTLTIRPDECRLKKMDDSIELEGEVSFIENFIQDGRKIIFIEKNGELFGVEAPLDYPVEKKERIKIYIPIEKAKYFDETGNPDSPERVYNLW